MQLLHCAIKAQKLHTLIENSESWWWLKWKFNKYKIIKLTSSTPISINFLIFSSHSGNREGAI